MLSCLTRFTRLFQIEHEGKWVNVLLLRHLGKREDILWIFLFVYMKMKIHSAFCIDTRKL